MFRLICPNCEHEYQASGDWEPLQGNIFCGYCDAPLAGPPILRLIPGGRQP